VNAETGLQQVARVARIAVAADRTLGPVNQRPAARAYLAAASGTKDYESGYQEFEQESAPNVGNLY
jgi:hypothetical protein